MRHWCFVPAYFRGAAKHKVIAYKLRREYAETAQAANDCFLSRSKETDRRTKATLRPLSIVSLLPASRTVFPRHAWLAPNPKNKEALEIYYQGKKELITDIGRTNWCVAAPTSRLILPMVTVIETID
uniref:Uncharacterized protein n=1 Tax=Candidatus Kentrum eta TaxID=2126337 RepID=A0A450V0X5_9GAMM|nr:MAG: hypothetical protein BECKH772A_GA0070896_1002328 [Candidatus Kentron sp. H]VFJ91809.1 MAG: hypothetical protein BECKH772B_GA0070898_1002128 [Candidatus Kentron sp. H]VFJ98458.1 MAG: hypothetical protein BECKH772C_GA0070978_1002128 [Candidatus Kentron sp. H]